MEYDAGAATSVPKHATSTPGSNLEKRIHNIRDQATSIWDKLKRNPHDRTITASAESMIVALEQLAFTVSKGKHITVNDTTLDDIGTRLWNETTILIREDAEKIDKTAVCTVRCAACFLIDCAEKLMKMNSSEFRVFKCYLKALKMCLDHEEGILSTKLVDKLSKLYDVLLKKELPRSANDQRTFCLVSVEYYLWRVTHAWRQESTALMDLMYSKLPPHLSSVNIPSKKLEAFVDAFYRIGTDFLRKKQYENADKWLGLGTELFLHTDSDADLSETTTELKFNVMRNQIRALYNAGKVEDIAKAKDLLRDMEEEFPCTIWLLFLKFDVAKNDKTSSPDAMLDIIMQMIFLGNLTEVSFKIILNAIQSLLNQNPVLACKALDYLLTKKLALVDQQDWLQDAFVLRVTAITKDSSMQQKDSINALRALFAAMEKMLSEPISAKAVIGAQTILWRIGESDFASEKYAVSLEWFRLGLHPIFYNSGEVNRAKILRKVMLCEFNLQNYSGVAGVYSGMPVASQESPLTQYILYITALATFDNALAQSCLQKISTSPTADARMMCACAMVAQEKDNKPMTLTAMKFIVQQLQNKDSGSLRQAIQVPALLRCVIRLMVLEIEKTAPNKAVSEIDQLCQYFENAYSLAKQLGSTPATFDSSFDANEFEWFARNAYNTALKGCKHWPPESTLRLSNCSLKFIALYHEKVDKTDAQAMDIILWQRITAVFLSSSAAIYLARLKEHIAEQRELFQIARGHVRTFRQVRLEYAEFISARPEIKDNIETRQLDLQAKFAAMLAFDFEAAANLEIWSELPSVTEEILKLKPELRIYESLVDVLLAASSPVDETLVVLQMILSATLLDQDNEIEKLSRWVRCLVTVSLPRRQDVTEQIVNQLLVKLGDFKERYPQEETHWLSTTCWNYGVDLYCTNNITGCKRWCEIAISLAGFVSETMEYQMQQNYLRICNTDNPDIL
ncbi:meiosis protein SPO22/ZIP4 like-domain-containing protein [Lipomyces kononenkoae]|uniref:Meiosis protein SPO22/ZIP4 like-domain-containing protein n=1 Tax=Lipomyces kononenkoae TaxID=34357 RepID=A0ACC3TAR5_LIPKO